ncbi:MAG: acetyl-CoA carboxylase biotin carboxyl carrier protein subunit [Bacteroidales bacterium]|nr:acetyl-CoA carboxylase biotin carboxyl carrier protein subunit [Bacteroidales bacterium]
MATKKLKVKKASTPKIIEETKPRLSTISTVHGENYKTFLTEKYKNRKKWQEPDPKKFYSQIPGTVIKVYVEEGQEVKEGELMMILESMKMKNRIYFLDNGIVKKIYVNENERIPKGHLMVELK